MIYEKVPVVPPTPFRELKVDEFTVNGHLANTDVMYLTDWKPPGSTQGRAIDVFDVHGAFKGTMIFVWGVNKNYLHWNQGGNK